MKVLFKLSPMDIELHRDIQMFPGTFITTDDIAKLNRELRNLLTYHLDDPVKLAQLGVKYNGHGYEPSWRPGDFTFLGNEDKNAVDKILSEWNDGQNARVLYYMDQLRNLVDGNADPDSPEAKRIVSRLRMAVADWADEAKTPAGHMVVIGYEPVHSRIGSEIYTEILLNPEDWAVLTVEED